MSSRRPSWALVYLRGDKNEVYERSLCFARKEKENQFSHVVAVLTTQNGRFLYSELPKQGRSDIILYTNHTYVC